MRTENIQHDADKSFRYSDWSADAGYFSAIFCPLELFVQPQQPFGEDPCDMPRVQMLRIVLHGVTPGGLILIGELWCAIT